jgi:hypothetical protein
MSALEAELIQDVERVEELRRITLVPPGRGQLKRVLRRSL